MWLFLEMFPAPPTHLNNTGGEIDTKLVAPRVIIYCLRFRYTPKILRQYSAWESLFQVPEESSSYTSTAVSSTMFKWACTLDNNLIKHVIAHVRNKDWTLDLYGIRSVLGMRVFLASSPGLLRLEFFKFQMRKHSWYQHPPLLMRCNHPMSVLMAVTLAYM